MNSIYARQSVDKKDSLSIEAQIELCKRYAGEDALVFQDRGFSGKNTKRPAFQELMHAIETGQVKKVFVYRLDRISRSVVDFGNLWEFFDQHQVEFLSCTEQFDTSAPIGRAMLNIILIFAQLERETIADRVKDNYIHRFTLGAWPGGPAPYGYSLTKVTDNGHHVSSLIPNEYANVVQEIFQSYVQAETSLSSLARQLSAKQIHGPKREKWDSVTLSRILHSPVYVRADEDIYFYYLSQGIQIQQDLGAFDGQHACNLIGRRERGKNKYHDTDKQMLTVANHPGVISSQLWLQVQKKLAQNRQLPRANAGKHSWLTGLLKCGRCGYAVRINYNKIEDKFYLLCSGRSNLSCCDNSISVSLRELENYVAQHIQSLLSNCPPEEMPVQSSAMATEILELDEKIERLITALAESSSITMGYLNKQIEVLHKKKMSLLQQKTPPSPRPTALTFDDLDFEEKKLVAAEFIQRIELAGTHVNIIWKV